MSMRPTFDVAATRIETGATRIEASAGTGKTYTIAGLVVRLLLEKELLIEEILVSTYTELATAELRDRIRTRIRDASAVFETGEAEDKFLSAIYEQHKSDSTAARRKLNDALLNFDQAPIYTMHGFCQRMLIDRAFESGALFDAELITDQADVLREIADDFWRRNFYDSPPLITLIAMKHGLSAGGFLKHLRELVNNPTLQIFSDVNEAAQTLQASLLKTWSGMQASWKADAARIRGHFAEGSVWAMRSRTQGMPEKMAALLDDLDQCFSERDGTAEQMKCLASFAQSAIDKAKLKTATAPEEPLFKHCESFLALEKNYAVRMQEDFFTWARDEMKRRKIERNVFSFDDLLTRLNDALANSGGTELAASIRGKFKAALIDEFQDTDPVQYEIFKKIYGGSDAIVFYIADPKQAIYGFRGADIFTYLRATDDVKRAYTLGENWRSETDLVSAVNTIFAQKKNAFVFDRIQFDPVKASGQADVRPLTVDGGKEPPLKIWMAFDDEPIPSPQATAMIPRAVASEISRLLNGDVKIGKDKVQPSDIAVVVSTNEEARLVQSALMELGVPGVIYSASSVFASHEARELAQILAAVAEPANERLLKGALVTDVLGVSGDALDASMRAERQWEERLLRFQKYHETWSRKGFVIMLRSLLQQEQVRMRLLRLPDGERRLTNLLQLSELLHRACIEQQLGMAGLLKWLAAEIHSSDQTRVDEHELRLERDEKSVCVVTVHKSKGLEYGIVFCPFTWGDAKPKRGAVGVSFHDSDNGDRLTLDISQESESREIASLNEELAQKIRLLYVAITRAKNRCYLVWGNFKTGHKSAPAYIFSSIETDGSDAFAQLVERSGEVSNETIRADVEAIVGDEKSIEIASVPMASGRLYLPTGNTIANLTAREFNGTIDRTWGVSSFTSLLTGAEPERPDYDEVEESCEASVDADSESVVVSRGSSTALRSARNDTLSSDAPSGMCAFPRGAKPGTCLHYIFEELDFCNLSTMPDLVRRKLEMFSIRGFDEVVGEMVRRMLTTPLDMKNLTLANVPRSACLHEMEFHFPIDALTPQRLAQFFKRHGQSEAIPETIGRLQFHPASGFMKGFIDLVFEHGGKFYIVDWKSNWLGDSLDSYSAPALATEMVCNFYVLQLHIYVVALHRYLAHRLPGYDYETHFGGVFYAFLRGVDPTRPESGIHRERPSREAIEKLSLMLGDRKESL